MTVEVKSENTQTAETADSPNEEAVQAIEAPVEEAEPEEKPNSAIEPEIPESAVETAEPEEKHNSVIEEKKPENPESAVEAAEPEEKHNSVIEEKKPENPESAVEAAEPEEKHNSAIEEKKPESPESAADEMKPDEPTSELEEKKPKSEEPSDSAEVIEKSSSFNDESNFLSDLKETEKKALIELKEKLEESILENKLFKKEEAAKTTETQEGDEEKENEEADDREVSLWGVPLLASKNDEATDVVLLKFLRAREFRVKESLEMLQATLQWRREEKIDSIMDETELGGDFGTACYMDGCDREGHPVCYNMSAVFRDEEVYKKAFGSEEGRKKFLRWRVQVMEKGIQKLDLKPSGVSNLLQVTDLKDSVGPSKKELRDTMKQALHILQDNYPEFVSKNVFINVPFWYYAFHALISPFLTQRTKSKFVFARPVHVTETLLKFIPAEAIPIRYGGFKRENDSEFSVEDGTVSELMLKSSSTETIEIPAPEVGATLVWDLSVLGWEVNYKEEFVPTDDGSYTVIVQKVRKIGPQEETVRNSFRTNEPGKMVLTVENKTFKKKRVLYRCKTKRS